MYHALHYLRYRYSTDNYLSIYMYIQFFLFLFVNKVKLISHCSHGRWFRSDWKVNTPSTSRWWFVSSSQTRWCYRGCSDPRRPVSKPSVRTCIIQNLQDLYWAKLSDLLWFLSNRFCMILDGYSIGPLYHTCLIYFIYSSWSICFKVFYISVREWYQFCNLFLFQYLHYTSL